MKCPRCESEHTHLSWLREFTVVYWCDECHAGFDVDRHQIRSIVASKPAVAAESDGASTFQEK